MVDKKIGIQNERATSSPSGRLANNGAPIRRLSAAEQAKIRAATGKASGFVNDKKSADLKKYSGSTEAVSQTQEKLKPNEFPKAVRDALEQTRLDQARSLAANKANELEKQSNFYQMRDLHDRMDQLFQDLSAIIPPTSASSSLLGLLKTIRKPYADMSYGEMTSGQAILAKQVQEFEVKASALPGFTKGTVAAPRATASTPETQELIQAELSAEDKYNLETADRRQQIEKAEAEVTAAYAELDALFGNSTDAGHPRKLSPGRMGEVGTAFNRAADAQANAKATIEEIGKRQKSADLEANSREQRLARLLPESELAAFTAQKQRTYETESMERAARLGPPEQQVTAAYEALSKLVAYADNAFDQHGPMPVDVSNALQAALRLADESQQKSNSTSRTLAQEQGVADYPVSSRTKLLMTSNTRAEQLAQDAQDELSYRQGSAVRKARVAQVSGQQKIQDRALNSLNHLLTNCLINRREPPRAKVPGENRFAPQRRFNEVPEDLKLGGFDINALRDHGKLGRITSAENRVQAEADAAALSRACRAKVLGDNVPSDAPADLSSMSAEIASLRSRT